MKNVNNDDIKTLFQAAQNAWDDAFGHEFDNDTWGLYCCFDAPLWAGGGSGGFIWFDSRECMLQFISTVLPYISDEEFCWDEPVLDAEFILEEANKINLVVDTIRKNGLSLDDGIKLINVSLDGKPNIEWCGQFIDLCECKSEFSIDLIASYRETQGSDIDDENIPINPSETMSFKEFIENNDP